MAAELSSRLHKVTAAKAKQLWDTWATIGFTSEQRYHRMETVEHHVDNLLTRMVEEEVVLKEKLESDVDGFRSELVGLSMDLNVQNYTPAPGLTLLELERELRLHVMQLEKMKHDRMKVTRKLQRRDQSLCDLFCTTPYYIPTGVVPSEEQIKELEEHVSSLEAQKEKRLHVFRNDKTKIIGFLNDLERSPDSSFERNVVCEEEESFMLTTENLNALRDLHDQLESEQKSNFALASQLRERLEQLSTRLQIPADEMQQFHTKYTGFRPKVILVLKEEVARYEKLQRQNMVKVVEGARQELRQLWDKSYISKEERNNFTPYHSDDVCDKLLQLIDLEVTRMKQYYEDNEEMLEKVARRQRLWLEFLQLERNASDPNRFFNRNCNLLKEEKARKRISKELPKVEQEVADEIAAWEKQYGRRFLVNGVPFIDFVKCQWQEHQEQREREKEQRHQARTKQTEEELMYGSKPTTPCAKRRFLAPSSTLCKTPTKIRRCGNDTTAARTPRTPNSVQRSRCQNTNALSIFSPICMPPRTRAAHKMLPPTTPQRRVLSDKNAASDRGVTPQATFSQTTVSGKVVSGDVSVAAVGPYQDFAKGLDNAVRPNCRSSVVPEKMPSLHH
ncbi:Protein regulator of cytokinesis 1 [Lamellibrachia satsuma]|nr:Protein regulator of cytokinesis 1 [Lamellibrachia satsuma]